MNIYLHSWLEYRYSRSHVFFFFRYLECVGEKNLDLVLYLSIALFFKFQSHNSVLYKELARMLYSNFTVSFPRNTLLPYFDFAISLNRRLYKKLQQVMNVKLRRPNTPTFLLLMIQKNASVNINYQP